MKTQDSGSSWEREDSQPNPQEDPRAGCRATSRRDICRPNIAHRAKVARRKENSVGKNCTRDEVMLRILKGWMLRRDTGINRNVTRGTRIKPYRKMTRHETVKRITESPVPSQNIKNWTLWRGRPPETKKME
jgi:hypothetical protein